MTDHTHVNAQDDVHPIPHEDFQLYNSLSNIQIARIIDMAAHHKRLDVFIGTQNKHCISALVADAFMNGVAIQVNLETTELKNLSDDPFWAKAFAEQPNPNGE